MTNVPVHLVDNSVEYSQRQGVDFVPTRITQGEFL